MNPTPTSATVDEATAEPGAITQITRRRVLISSTVGSTIEWYHFYLYSTAAALVLGPLRLPLAVQLEHDRIDEYGVVDAWQCRATPST